jgi:hypothetical protein
MEQRDRRYFALKVSSAHAQDIDYFKMLHDSYQHPEFYSHLLTYFLRMDTSALDIHIPLMTDLKSEMLDAGMSYQEMFIRTRDAWCTMDLNRDNLWRQAKNVWARYVAWLDEEGIPPSKDNGNMLTFSAKVAHLIEKKKSSGVWYRPNEKLHEIWVKELEADPEHQRYIKDLEAMGFSKSSVDGKKNGVATMARVSIRPKAPEAAADPAPE